MNRFVLFVLGLLITFSVSGQKNKDQSGPNNHLIKKNLQVDGNISSAGGKNLVLQTNKITRITVLNSNGFMGLGMSSPKERLHIDGAIRGNSTGGAVRISTAHGWLDLGPQDGQSVHMHTNLSKFVINKEVRVDGPIGTYGPHNLELRTNGNTHITILDDNGFVGMGVTNPTERLDVAGNLMVSETLDSKDLVSETLYTIEGKFDGNVDVGENLKVAGIVGIGVAEPTEKLEVAGNAKVSDTLSATNLEAEGGDFSDQVHIVNQLILDGNMGIGVESPREKLEVAGIVKATEKVIATSIEAVNADFSDQLNVVNDAKIGGNLGIGVENPNEKLEVEGNVKVTDKITATDLEALNGKFSGELSVANNIDLGGNLGVGVAAPAEKLEVAGNAVVSETLTVKNVSTEGVSLNGDLSMTGHLGIGTDDTHGYKVAVAGDMIIEEIVIDLEIDWPDYVFEENYTLRSLEETASFISTHKHLPEMPSAQEVKTNGVKIGEMNVLLLKKIEELTIHIIEMKAENNKIRKVNQDLVQRLQAIEKKHQL